MHALINFLAGYVNAHVDGARNAVNMKRCEEDFFAVAFHFMSSCNWCGIFPSLVYF